MKPNKKQTAEWWPIKLGFVQVNNQTGNLPFSLCSLLQWDVPILTLYIVDWVELGGGVTPPVEAQSIYNGNLEKLLIEAQRESRSSSRPNSKESSARGR